MILKKIEKGFTLVELIIVITILAVLSTIGFLSFQGYTKTTRDSNRLATLKSIDTGLQANFETLRKYPLPENYINILSSGSTIGYQGYFGDDASRLVKMNKTPTDPLDSKKYTYSVNSSQSSYQLLTFLESSDILAFEFPEFIEKSYAASNDYSKRFPKSSGKDLGILLGTSGSYLNTPIHELKNASFTGTYTGSIGGNNVGNLKAVFSKESDNISGTGQKLSILE